MNTFGACLGRDSDGFVISYGEGMQRQKIPAVGISGIQVGRGAQVTSDAILLAVEKEIEVVFVDKAGVPQGRVWSPRYGSISTIRKGQLAFTFAHESVDWIKDLICQKIANQQALLLLMRAESDEMTRKVEKSIWKLEDYRNKIAGVDGDVVSDVAAALRGWEGLAAKVYFETMNIFLPESLRFASRSQHPAMDVVNAMLNYGYGLLYSKIEGALLKTGVDPYIGVMHRDDYNRPVLVYDIIEIYRVWVDYVVFSLVTQNVITDEYYSVREDGSYWLEALGRRILIQSVNDYLDEVVTQRGVQRSRGTQILLYCQDLAQKFKQFC